jgi:hypothetical protein
MRALSVPSLTPHPAAVGVELRYVRVDPFNPVVASHADAMVAVQDEVEAPYLVEAHRRQLLTPMEGPVYALPPLPHARLGGHEVSIELGTPANAATYLSYWHRPHAPIDPPHCPGDLSDLVEAQQSVSSVVSSQSAPHPPKQCPSACIGEVRVYLHFQVHMSNHRLDPFLGLSDATSVGQSLTRRPTSARHALDHLHGSLDRASSAQPL